MLSMAKGSRGLKERCRGDVEEMWPLYEDTVSLSAKGGPRQGGTEVRWPPGERWSKRPGPDQDSANSHPVLVSEYILGNRQSSRLPKEA